MSKTQLALLATVVLAWFPAMAATRNKSAPASAIGAIGSWFPPDSYPAEAKLKGEQGRVSVELAIDRTGRPSSCRVVGSSGSAALDAKTCELALANARFTPALNAKGRPVATTFKLPAVRWVS